MKNKWKKCINFFTKAYIQLISIENCQNFNFSHQQRNNDFEGYFESFRFPCWERKKISDGAPFKFKKISLPQLQSIDKLQQIALIFNQKSASFSSIFYFKIFLC